MNKKPFGKIRSVLWPVHSYEIKRVGSMALTFFFFAMTYHILRQMKDSVFFVVSGNGMEAMPFIKFCGLIPMSICMTILFSYIRRTFSRSQTIYVITSLFLAYFIAFASLFYPYRETFEASTISEQIKRFLPYGLKPLASVIKHWYATIFFSMAELWGSIIMHTAFWGFTNEVTLFEDAQRIYSIMCVSINLAGIIGGLISAKYIYFYSPSFIGLTTWDQGVFRSSILLISSGILGLLSFTYLNSQIKQSPSEFRKEQKIKKVHFCDELKFIMKNRNFAALSFIIFAFGFISTSVEIFWKEQTRMIYSPESGMFSSYMSSIIGWTSVLATVTSLFVSGSVTRYFGWTVTALLTPAIVIITAAGFFTFLIFSKQTTQLAALVGCSPIDISLFFGSASVCLSRVCKYSFFDNAKELAFVKLESSNNQSKSVIDGLVSRLGKSSSSLLSSVLIAIFGSLLDSTATVAVICSYVGLVWLKETVLLGEEVCKSNLESNTKNHMSQ